MLIDGRSAAEIEAAERREAAGEEVVVNRRVVAGEADARREREHVPARVVGPFVQQQVLAGVEHGSRILEAADDLFQLQLQEVAFGRQERAVARIVGDGPLEAVHRVVADDFGELGKCRVGRIADLDVFAAVREGRREIVLDPLVAERDAAADALFVPIAITCDRRTIRSDPGCTASPTNTVR